MLGKHENSQHWALFNRWIVNLVLVQNGSPEKFEHWIYQDRRQRFDWIHQIHAWTWAAEHWGFERKLPKLKQRKMLFLNGEIWLCFPQTFEASQGQQDKILEHKYQFVIFRWLLEFEIVQLECSAGVEVFVDWCWPNKYIKHRQTERKGRQNHWEIKQREKQQYLGAVSQQ